MGLRPLHLRSWFARKRWASSSTGAVKGGMSSLAFGRFYQKKRPLGDTPRAPRYGPAAHSLALFVRTETVGEFVSGRCQMVNAILGLRVMITIEQTAQGDTPGPPVWACGPFTCAFGSHGNGGRVRPGAPSRGKCHPWASGDFTNTL